MTAPRPVLMPAEPPYAVLKAMAGDPLILAASDAINMRSLYLVIRRMLALTRSRK